MATEVPHSRLFDEFDRLCDVPAVEQAERLRQLQAADPELAQRLRELLAEDVGGGDPGSSLVDAVWKTAGEVLEPNREGQTIGRFVLGKRLGEGGMGVVHAAVDTELERGVAVKVIRAIRPDVSERARLLQEARAMAKVAHPNVITIFEAGTAGDEVFIAMELVEGQTLREWVGSGDRTCQEILEVYAEAAAGLLAAHEAGLVHRDFKPDNVLIGANGRPRVLDFGIARPFESLDEPLRGGTRPPFAHALVTANIAVNTTSILGTPGYMAPEQFRGGPTDPRTDQFAFCVALYEALHGVHPFAEDSVAELFARVAAGEVRPPPAAVKLPGRLRAVLLRGLAAEPDDRWPSMSALLQALQRGTARPGRRRRVMAAAAGILVFAGGWWFVRASASPRAPAAALVTVAAVPPTMASRCLIAYDEPDFQGQWWPWCPDDPAPPTQDWDDRISSVWIPTGFKAQLCTEPGASGRCILLLDSAPRIGVVDDRVSSVKWGAFEPQVFSILIASGSIDDATRQRLTQAASDVERDQFVGVVLQGDIASLDSASFAHFHDRYDLGLHVWPGWEESSAAGCWETECEATLVDHLSRSITAPTAMRIDSTDQASPGGSFAYSWAIGEHHFIQLHDGIEASRAPASPEPMHPSREWLVNELAWARQGGKTVVLFAAQVGQQLQAVVAEHPDVAAIFTRAPQREYLGLVPLLPNGPTSEVSMWRVDFDSDRIMVYGVMSSGRGIELRGARSVDVPLGFRQYDRAAIVGHNDKVFAGLSKAECASTCVHESEFECLSFDYDASKGDCQLSRVSSNEVPLQWGYSPWTHYGRPSIPQGFVFMPNAAIKGHNTRLLTQTTLDRCLRACETEAEFECRSIDYERRQGICDLSDVSADDVGLMWPYRVYDHFEREL